MPETGYLSFVIEELLTQQKI